MKTLEKSNRASKSSGRIVTKQFKFATDIVKMAEELAEMRGQTVNEVITDALRAKVDEKSRSVTLTPENARRAREVADLLEIGFEDYANSVLEEFLDDVYGGRVGEVEGCSRTFDSRAEAERIVRRIDKFDEVTDRRWVIEEKAPGVFCADY
jgi:hypothetical protein